MKHRLGCCDSRCRRQNVQDSICLARLKRRKVKESDVSQVEVILDPPSWDRVIRRLWGVGLVVTQTRIKSESLFFTLGLEGVEMFRSGSWRS
ncbi:hypothetical protein HPP92_022735 [Vanilla planifolia]|uniref:Uncharacterized protein n=1 Tax=Vanilla planifolia TaxID=51239 RepID=A0A835UFD3_VANPL|nr:hypothetical protein HPP92_022735 [Vanilla planifolia]